MTDGPFEFLSGFKRRLDSTAASQTPRPLDTPPPTSRGVSFDAKLRPQPELPPSPPVPTVCPIVKDLFVRFANTGADTIDVYYVGRDGAETLLSTVPGPSGPIDIPIADALVSIDDFAPYEEAEAPTAGPPDLRICGGSVIKYVLSTLGSGAPPMGGGAPYFSAAMGSSSTGHTSGEVADLWSPGAPVGTYRTFSFSSYDFA